MKQGKVSLKVMALIVSALLSSLSFAKENIKPSIDHLQTVDTYQNDKSIALTFDACGGKTDWNILHFLVDNQIPATIFVTAKWIDKNQEGVDFLKSHPDIFKIENHGQDHKEAVYQKVGAYHLPTTENQEGLETEINGGEKAIEKAFGVKASWYRDAGALYDTQSINWLHQNNWQIGGYSIAGDEGATASKERIIMILSQAKPGDVILMHMNKPQGHTFEGMRVGVEALKNKSYQFSWLN